MNDSRKTNWPVLAHFLSSRWLRVELLNGHNGTPAAHQCQYWHQSPAPGHLLMTLKKTYFTVWQSLHKQRLCSMVTVVKGIWQFQLSVITILVFRDDLFSIGHVYCVWKVTFPKVSLYSDKLSVAVHYFEGVKHLLLKLLNWRAEILCRLLHVLNCINVMADSWFNILINILNVYTSVNQYLVISELLSEKAWKFMLIAIKCRHHRFVQIYHMSCQTKKIHFWWP